MTISQKSEIIQQICDSGIVGAGGAGFPTHVKVNATVDTVIINGAECEPLLYKDKELMRLYPEEMLSGLKIVMELTDAKRGIVALKAKNKKAIPVLEKLASKDGNIEIAVIDDVYPSGDEVVLVYEVTNRIVPPGGIPLNVGCVVSNTETFINIHRSINENKSVIKSYITLAGEVKTPITIEVPIGIRIKDILDFAGGVTCNDPVFIDGGPMMGSVIDDLDYVVTKGCAGFIVLDRTHPLVQRKTKSVSHKKKIGKSACDQCSYCTEFCPRYLLGHNVRPHMVMRSLGMIGHDKDIISKWSSFCVECKLCSLYACPEMLYPGEICGLAKQDLWKNNIKVTQDNKNLKVHPMREYRKLPTSLLIRRLDLKKYEVAAHFEKLNIDPNSVTIPLSQHIGSPAIPLVKKGNTVKIGQCIGTIPEKKLGAKIHASISGMVSEITEKYIKIERIK